MLCELYALSMHVYLSVYKRGYWGAIRKCVKYLVYSGVDTNYEGYDCLHLSQALKCDLLK